MGTETRRTNWISTDGRIAWAGSGIAAYRIWKEFDGRRWFQRHEWQHEDGTIREDDWIDSATGWGLTFVPASQASDHPTA